MHNIANAVKNAIEPMFGNALMMATQSSQNKQWIKKARKVHTCSHPNSLRVQWRASTFKFVPKQRPTDLMHPVTYCSDVRVSV